MSPLGQRQIMGPPETPSRGMIPQSPGLFSNLQFSPDIYALQQQQQQQHPFEQQQQSQHNHHQQQQQQSQMLQYPQQRLFWDPSTATPLQGTPQHFHTPAPFPNDFDTSFNSQATIMPQHFVVNHEEMPYDLPDSTQSLHASFMDNSVFPAPFQTSPRMAPLPQENPTHFLSSPARRFGGNQDDGMGSLRNKPGLPAYHHQIQESKREKELTRDRKRSRSTKQLTEDDLVSKSVKRALSPSKAGRPSATRSFTSSGIPTQFQRSNSLLDSTSRDSGSISGSRRGGGSSPIRKDHSRKSSASRTLRHRASMNLAIDQHGVARTVMNTLPENDDTDMDDASTDVLSSDDEPEQDMLYSFSGDPYNDSRMLGDARDELRSNAHLGSIRMNRSSSGLGSNQSYDMSTIRRRRTDTLNSTTSFSRDATLTHNNAQQALRAMMQERSHSTSSHDNQSSNSSMQFHSSPPLQPGHLATGYANHSPGTLTDPDLLTPGTDVDSVSIGSTSTTRCVCKSSSPDGNIMVQW